MRPCGAVASQIFCRLFPSKDIWVNNIDQFWCRCACAYGPMVAISGCAWRENPQSGCLNKLVSARRMKIRWVLRRKEWMDRQMSKQPENKSGKIRNGLPRQNLYDPANEHDACGLGFVANIKTSKYDIVRDGLTILENLEHRGAVGADPKAGDGVSCSFKCPCAFPQGHIRTCFRPARRRRLWCRHGVFAAR